jgi:TonB family protein
VAPAEKRVAAKVAALADAPEVAEKRLVAVADLGAPVVPRGPVRGFVAPAEKQRSLTVAALIGVPPEVKEKRALTVAPRIGAPDMAPAVADAPAVAGPGAVAEASMAIVGLNPARTIDVPPPPGSRTAGFSAGEQPRADGGTGANSIALLNVPGLVVKGGAKDTQPTLATSFSPTSRENLLAAARVTMGAAPKAVAAAGAHLSGVVAPDPRFAGRTVYTIAIQMPNVTSFSGSWLVWFAEREPLAGAAAPQIRAPVVVRKVDPKYIAAAAAERVEGTVRLFAVIGKDGHVGGIALLRQLDDRLDRSAQEALAKWEFGPALRDGVPVDVDAIFEIPFHLAPRPNQ